MPLDLHLLWLGGRFEQVESVFVALARKPFAHMQTRVLHAREALSALAMKPAAISHPCAYYLSAAFRTGVPIAFLSRFILSLVDRQMFANDYDSSRARPASVLPSRYMSDSHRIFLSASSSGR